MIITTEYLESLCQKAEAQRARLQTELNQATGALAMLQLMLAKLNEPEQDETKA